jgi:hypothetical protein
VEKGKTVYVADASDDTNVIEGPEALYRWNGTVFQLISQGKVTSEYLNDGTSWVLVGRGNNYTVIVSYEDILNKPDLSQLHNQNSDTGTSSNSFRLGDGLPDSEKAIEADNGATFRPFLKYNPISKTWQFSNDGENAKDMGSGDGTGGTGGGDMLKTTYDKNGDGIVDAAEKVAGIDAAGNDVYYGKNAVGTTGFFKYNEGHITVNSIADRNAYTDKKEGISFYVKFSEADVHSGKLYELKPLAMCTVGSGSTIQPADVTTWGTEESHYEVYDHPGEPEANPAGHFWISLPNVTQATINGQIELYNSIGKASFAGVITNYTSATLIADALAAGEEIRYDSIVAHSTGFYSIINGTAEATPAIPDTVLLVRNLVVTAEGVRIVEPSASYVSDDEFDGVLWLQDKIIGASKRVLGTLFNSLKTSIGKLADLKTSSKGSLVSAINEIFALLGLAEATQTLNNLDMSYRYQQRTPGVAGTTDSININNITGVRLGAVIRLAIKSANSDDSLSGFLSQSGLVTSGLTVNGIVVTAQYPVYVEQEGFTFNPGVKNIVYAEVVSFPTLVDANNPIEIVVLINPLGV